MKLNKLYNKNKIVFILITIMIICFVIILIGLLTSFYKKVSTSKYGDRLEEIKNVEITDSDKDNYVSDIEKEDGVSSASIDIKGKIVYILIEFEDGTKVKEAKTVAKNSLSSLEEDVTQAYDIQYILSCEEDEKNYPTMGYKNNTSEDLVWINRN